MLWDAFGQSLDALCRQEHDVRVGLMPNNTFNHCK